MKKIIFSIFALALLAFALVSCGEDQPEDKPQEQPTTQDVTKRDVLLEDATKNQMYNVTNQHYNNWNNFDVEGQKPEDSQMKAAKINDVKNQALADKLAARDIKYLYVFEGFVAGTEEVWAGWTTKAAKGAELVVLDGSYAVKAIVTSVKEIEGVVTYSAKTWMPDTNNKFYAENLTPDVLWTSPNNAAEADANGFSWNYNPTLVGGAGEYTIVLAVYGKDAPKDASGTVYGGAFAAFKTKDLQEYVKPTDQSVVAEGDVVGVIGANGDWENDVVMTLNADGKYEAEVEFTTPDDKGKFEFKVRLNHAWASNWGNADGSNASVPAAGKYKVIFNPFTTEITAVPANA